MPHTLTKTGALELQSTPQEIFEIAEEGVHCTCAVLENFPILSVDGFDVHGRTENPNGPDGLAFLTRL